MVSVFKWVVMSVVQPCWWRMLWVMVLQGQRSPQVQVVMIHRSGMSPTCRTALMRLVAGR